MAKNKSGFVLNRQGVRELLRSEEMQEHLATLAAGIQGRCGPGFKSDSYKGKNRANAMIWADSVRAKRKNSKDNTILKAVRG